MRQVGQTLQAVKNLFENLSWGAGERRSVHESSKKAMDWAEENGLVQFVSQVGGLLYYRRTTKEIQEIEI